MKKDTTAVLALIAGILLLLTCGVLNLFYIFSSQATPQALLAEGGFSAPGGIFQGMGLKNAPPPESVVVEYMNGIDTGVNGERFTLSTDGSRLFLDCEPSTPEGRLLFSFLQKAWSFQISKAETEDLKSVVTVYITCPDTELFAQPLKQAVTEALAQKVAAAARVEEIYDENGHFRKEITDDAFWSALGTVSADAKQKYSVTVSATLNLEFYERQWHIMNPAQLNNTLDMRVQAQIGRAHV